MSEPPHRVRVTGPRAGRPRRTSVAAEIDAQSRIGEVYMTSLLRSQLRLALRTVAALAATVGLLPLLLAVFPVLRTTRVLGVELPWVLLGFAVYPLLLALAWWYVRGAERNERSFQDLLRPPGDR